MSEITSFSELMKECPVEKMNKDTVFDRLVHLVIELEDEYKIPRDTICKALIEGTLLISNRRPDQPKFRNMSDVRHILYWASEFTKKKLDKYYSYGQQKRLEATLGKDADYLRDARFHGWKDPNAE